MSSVCSDASDRQSERYDSYTFSADVSEAETSSSFFCRREGDEEAAYNTSVSSSPMPSGFIDIRFSLPRPRIVLPIINSKDVEFQEKPEKQVMNLSEITMMKERFAKLLLGEDMSGSGKGVCTALAISNAITNLSASIFGELWRLEPLAEQKQSMWRREMEWLLCVSDSIVELVPSLQKMPDGGTYEVMTTRPRSDLYMNLPALKKLDAMLLNILDGFEETEFWYVDRGIAMDDSSFSSSRRPSFRQEDKWWLPSPQVSPTGMTKEARGKLQKSRDCTNQILKAAMAINSCVLGEMDIPDAYLENLPKSAKACLGAEMYAYTTDDQFDPQVLDRVDLTSEHRRIEVANRMESAIYVWREKENLNQRTPKRLSWTGKTKSQRCFLFAERAEVLLHHLRLRFPNLPQTGLDMSKIQYNEDVGHAILESYSRVMESLAFNIMARIDDLLYVDDAAKQSSAVESASVLSRRGLSGGFPMVKPISPSPFSLRQTPYSSPFATPIFSGSSPLPGSPKQKGLLGRGGVRSLSQKTLDFDKIRSYADSLSAMKGVGDAHERD